MSKFLRVGAVALVIVAAMGAGAAQARDNHVQWSVTIGAPVFLPPPVLLPPPVYAVPAPVWRAPAPVHYVPRYQEPTHWDHDGDGIPNRYDRAYNPRWDVDGDGIPNRYDHRQRARWDHDRDGVPNRYDRHDHNPWRR